VQKSQNLSSQESSTPLPKNFMVSPGPWATPVTSHQATQPKNFSSSRTLFTSTPVSEPSIISTNSLYQSGVLTESIVLEKYFAHTAPKSPFSKLLFLISLLNKCSLIGPQERDTLKQLAISNDENLLCALEVFEIQKDCDEIADTFKEVVSIVGRR
jgi:hypothetical protein